MDQMRTGLLCVGTLGLWIVLGATAAAQSGVPESELAAIAEVAQQGRLGEAVDRLDQLIAKHPTEARLHQARVSYLGSLLQNPATRDATRSRFAGAARAWAALLPEGAEKTKLLDLAQQVQQPGPTKPTDGLTGLQRIELKTAESELRGLPEITDADGRRRLLESVLRRTSALRESAPNHLGVWRIQAIAGLELGNEADVRQAAKHLLRLGAAESEDASLGALLVAINTRGWLVPPPPLPPLRMTKLAAKNTKGYDEYTLDQDPSVVMILIPGGTFTMGSTDGDSDEKPTRRVTLSPYVIGKHEITWGQYKRFCDVTKRPQPANPDFPRDDRHPVVNVSWDDAVAYARWVGVWRSDKRPGLPTEAEWEFAARGGEGRVYPWGPEIPTAAAKRCNMGTGSPPYRDAADGYEYTAPVGSFTEGAGPFGTLDQAGNVWEWCADWYAPYPSNAESDPIGPESASGRVLRGGCWYSGAANLRASGRVAYDPGNRDDDLGFRLASQVTP